MQHSPLAPPDGERSAASAESNTQHTPERRTPSQNPWRPAVRFGVLAVGAVVLVWLLVSLRSVLLQSLIAIILATGLAPLKRRLQQLGLPNLLATLLIFIGLLLFGVGLVALLLPALIRNTEQFAAQAPTLARELQQHLQGLLERFPFLSTLGEELAAQLRNLARALASASINLIGFVSNAVLSTFLTLFMTFYLLSDGTRIRDYLLAFFPSGRRPPVRLMTDRMGERMGHWLLGQLILCLVIGAACTGVLLVLRVPGALVLGVIAGVLELIPNIGPFLAAIPAALVALTQSPLLALVTILAYWGIQALENAVLVPKLMGRAVNLHPLAVILALLVGGTLFGIIGTLVAIPLTAALAVLLEEIQRLVGAIKMQHDAGANEDNSPPSTHLDEAKGRDRELP